MTPQERQLIDELFDRLAKLENAPRDADAVAAIAQGLRNAPNAIYPLVQTVLVQDEALKRANTRIQDLEQALAAGQGQGQSGGFLDSMRDKIFGQEARPQSRGSVPNVPPPLPENRPVWNSGQAMQQVPPGRYDQGPYGQGAPYGQGYGQAPYGAPPTAFGGGGSFLGTAAAAAAGAVGGSLLLNGIRGMMGGHHQAFGDTALINEPASSPGSDQSDSAMARDLGVNDVGHAADHTDDSRAGLFDQASNDDDNNRDDMDLDSDDFGGNSDSDYA